MLKLPSKFTQFLLVLRGEVGYRKLGDGFLYEKSTTVHPNWQTLGCLSLFGGGLFIRDCQYSITYMGIFWNILYQGNTYNRCDSSNSQNYTQEQTPIQSYFGWWQNPAPVGRWCIPLLYPLFTVFRSFQ